MHTLRQVDEKVDWFLDELVEKMEMRTGKRKLVIIQVLKSGVQVHA